MAPGKISFKLTGSPFLNNLLELNWIERYEHSKWYSTCKQWFMLNTLLDWCTI